MQTTEQLDLPSRDAKPGSGNHNNKHNFHGEDGKFIPSPNSPNKSSNSNSKSPPPPERRRQTKEFSPYTHPSFRRSQRFAGSKNYPEYNTPEGWFIDISFNIKRKNSKGQGFPPEQLEHPEFPANIPHWREFSHESQYKDLDITKQPSEHLRYYGGRPWICNSRLKTKSCGNLAQGMTDILDIFGMDSDGHICQRCKKCKSRVTRNNRRKLRQRSSKSSKFLMKPNPPTRGSRKIPSRDSDERPECINGNECIGNGLAKKNYTDSNKYGKSVWKWYCETCYQKQHYPVASPSGVYQIDKDGDDEQYHKEVRKASKLKAGKYANKYDYITSSTSEKQHGNTGNQNARKYPQSLTPKQRYAIRKGRGYWDEDTQSFKNGRRPT